MSNSEYAFKESVLRVICIALTLLFVGSLLEAEPSWARKYNAKCTLCHTTYPRLNRTGYNFKRLGYRLPKEVGVEQQTATVTSAVAPWASHEPFVIQPTGYKAPPMTPTAEQGKAVFEKANCSGCHSIAGKGGRIGPPLDGVGGRRTEEFLIAHLTNPEEHAKKFPELHGKQPNRMPHPHLAAEEVKLVVAYMLTLPEPEKGFQISPHSTGELPESQAVNLDYVPATVTDSSRAGEKLYFDLGCSSCHSIAKNGGEFGPALDGIGARRSRQFIMAHIANPAGHTEQFPAEHTGESAMPETEASPEQVEQIADFLITLPLPEEVQLGAAKGRIQDYVAVSYAPAVEIERENGVSNTTYEKRELIIYAAGPVGQYFSFFVQPLPASEEPGFLGKFEMIQGQLNHGNSSNFLQIRFGQIFNLRNAGFAGTDRGLTETLPLIFQPVNAFNPGGLGRGVSAEYTWKATTTFKVFGNYNEAPELEEEESEFERSRTYGFAVERLLGENGLSGIQFQFAGGYTPLVVEDVSQGSVRFQRFSFFANKTIQDSKNFERANIIFGVSLLRDNRFLGIDSDNNSHGYGYFIEGDAIPVVDHLAFFGRFDQLRPTTLVSGNVIRAETFGVIYDVVKYVRISFQYQRLSAEETSDNFRIGWQFNY